MTSLADFSFKLYQDDYKISDVFIIKVIGQFSFFFNFKIKLASDEISWFGNVELQFSSAKFFYCRRFGGFRNFDASTIVNENMEVKTLKAEIQSQILFRNQQIENLTDFLTGVSIFNT